jgi:hypothetical protein
MSDDSAGSNVAPEIPVTLTVEQALALAEQHLQAGPPRR